MPLLSAYFIPGCIHILLITRDEEDWALHSEAHGLGQWCTKQGQNCFHNTFITLRHHLPFFALFTLLISALQKQWQIKPLGKTP